MKECYPASMCGQEECSPWFKRFRHSTYHLVRVAVEEELLPDDITGFAQWRRMWEDKRLDTYCTFTISSRSMYPGKFNYRRSYYFSYQADKGKFTQGNKVEEKRLTHRVVIDEGELDFLIQDCIKERTYAGSDKYPLGHILTHYEDHQHQYTHLRASMLAYVHINLLEMLRRFGPNEVGGANTSKFQCPHKIPSCAMCEAGVFYSKEAAKEFANEHKPPFVCAVCFREWYFRLSSQKNTKPSRVVTKESEPLKEEKIREIQPGQWRDKGEKIHGPDPNVIYWPKNRHWESIKNITESTAPSIYDPITRSRVSYLNGGNINMVVFTHTNALAKDFQNDRKNGVGKWTPERIREKKFPRVVIWDEKCQVICCEDDAQSPPFFGEMPHSWLKEQADYYEEVLTDYRAKSLPVTEKWEYLEAEWKPSNHGCKQNCLVLIPGSSEKKELVKNDIIHLPLNTLLDEFLKDMLADKKVIDWELGYAMTNHTSQGMTLKALQRVWVINENLAWDNLIYLAVGRVEYLHYLLKFPKRLRRQKRKDS
ncbi:hypothetical protein RhiirC2_773709 [Rhizophagus irregularis]|uniref:Uncharacterized protein n=1 Tax=Rhizophagus irregularis TaxID=588596 RepID=A0A2N1NN59_9GLOM|nr:hypothetical protein RhiirC2_773709 [Rhizophagus irregularis]